MFLLLVMSFADGEMEREAGKILPLFVLLNIFPRDEERTG